MMILGNQFHFVRHAETEWNEKKLCQGLKDIPLSSYGKEKSLIFAQSSIALPIDLIFTSPLARALETAKIIQLFHPKAKIEILDELKERDWGFLEGISSEKMYQIEEMEEADCHFDPGHGIESRQNLRKRLVKGLNKAFSLQETPFIVSHGRVFLSLCEILKLPLTRQIPNLTIVEFAKKNSKWQQKTLNLK